MESGESYSWANHINRICELYGIPPEELVKKDKIAINNNQKGGTSTNALIINQLSEKLIEQYETRLKEKDILIEELRKVQEKHK